MNKPPKCSFVLSSLTLPLKVSNIDRGCSNISDICAIANRNNHKVLNVDYIKAYWRGTDDKTTIEEADGIMYTYDINFDEFLKLMPYGATIN